MSRSLCVFGSEAGDPAGLRFSVTHNINHVTEVGQTEQEIHLKCAGTARAGGRHCAPELITKWPHAAGSGCYCFNELKSKPGTFGPLPGTAWITEFSKTSGIYVVWSLNSWNQCLIIWQRRFLCVFTAISPLFCHEEVEQNGMKNGEKEGADSAKWEEFCRYKRVLTVHFTCRSVFMSEAPASTR